MGLWDQIKSIFQDAEDSQASTPVLHEVLSRHKDEAEPFARWREGLVCRRLLDWLSLRRIIEPKLPMRAPTQRLEQPNVQTGTI
jgi:hypothetical protein